MSRRNADSRRERLPQPGLLQPRPAGACSSWEQLPAGPSGYPAPVYMFFCAPTCFTLHSRPSQQALSTWKAGPSSRASTACCSLLSSPQWRPWGLPCLSWQPATRLPSGRSLPLPLSACRRRCCALQAAQLFARSPTASCWSPCWWPRLSGVTWSRSPPLRARPQEWLVGAFRFLPHQFLLHRFAQGRQRLNCC